jgi:hypothetical protein
MGDTNRTTSGKGSLGTSERFCQMTALDCRAAFAKVGPIPFRVVI